MNSALSLEVITGITGKITPVFQCQSTTAVVLRSHRQMAQRRVITEQAGEIAVDKSTLTNKDGRVAPDS